MEFMKTGIRVLGFGLLALGAIAMLLLALRMGSIYGWHHVLREWLANDVGLRPTVALLGALLGDAILLVTFWSLVRLVIFGTFSSAMLGVVAALFAVFAALTMFGEYNVPQPIAADRPLFHRDGKPNAWCAGEDDHLECFDLPGHHPRTGVKLEPVNESRARKLAARHTALREQLERSLAAAAPAVAAPTAGPLLAATTGLSTQPESLAERPSARPESVQVAARASAPVVNLPSSSYPRVQFDVVAVEARADTVRIKIRYRNRTPATLYLSHPGAQSECGDGARLSDEDSNEYACRQGLGQIADGRGLELLGGGSATHVFTFAATGRVRGAARRFTLRLPHVISEFTNPQGFQGTFGHQAQTIPLPVANYPLLLANIPS